MSLNQTTKPLYQPWNEEEFQSDIFVRNMKPIQRWMYRTLLQSMFFHSTRPFLPKDDNLLWMLAGCESKEQWVTHKEAVLSMFVPVEELQDMLQNKRVNEDWKKLMKSRKRYSQMGRESAKKRQTYAEHTLNQGSRSKGKGEGEGSGGKGRAKSAAASSTFNPEEI